MKRANAIRRFLSHWLREIINGYRSLVNMEKGLPLVVTEAPEIEAPTPSSPGDTPAGTAPASGV